MVCWPVKIRNLCFGVTIRLLYTTLSFYQPNNPEGRKLHTVMQARGPLILLTLALTYVGPYAFVYARTATWTFPRIDERDADAFDGVEVLVAQAAELERIESVSGAQRATYSVNVNLMHRKFLDWIGFPLVLEVNDFTFSATGVYQGSVVMACSQFDKAFDKPTGVEPWYIYQPLVDKNDNTTVEVGCTGDASAINLASLPVSISFNWSVEATLVGDRNEKVRSWTGSQTVEVRNVRP